MKTTLSVVLLIFALSLCNLMGKRGNTNTNGNSRSSGEMAESSPTPSPVEEKSSQSTDAAPPTITQGVRPAAAPNAPPLRANQNSAASAPPPPKTISGGVLNGKAISLPKPAYPAIARAARASGTVNVQVTVDENGNVINARPVSGHPLLQASATSAARQAKFSPTIIGGQRVKVTGVITFNFVAP